MKADEMLVPLDASPLAEGAPLRPDPDLHARAAEATTLPAVDPSDAEGEVVGEAASSETVRRLLRERVVCNEIARIHRVARRHGS